MSIAIDNQLIYYSSHSTSIVENLTGVYLWPCTTNSLGTNLSQLLSTQEEHLYQAWRCASFEPPCNSIHIVVQLIYCNWHTTSILEKQKGTCLVLAVYDKHTLNKFLSAPYHQGSALVPCLEAFIVQTAWQQHPYWYLALISAIALVYWRYKTVCSSSCVRWTHLEQIFGRFSLSRKCIGTMLWGVHLWNSWAAASPLISLDLQ